MKRSGFFNWKSLAGVGLGLLVLGLLVYGGLSVWQGIRARRMDEKRARVFPEIKVEVLNAAGAQDLAKRVSWRLRNMGFDVVYYGNASDTLSRTVVIERSDSSLANARELAWAINCQEITYEPDPDHLLDVTLIVGKDYERVFKGIEEDEVLF